MDENKKYWDDKISERRDKFYEILKNNYKLNHKINEYDFKILINEIEVDIDEYYESCEGNIMGIYNTNYIKLLVSDCFSTLYNNSSTKNFDDVKEEIQDLLYQIETYFHMFFSQKESYWCKYFNYKTIQKLLNFFKPLYGKHKDSMLENLLGYILFILEYERLKFFQKDIIKNVEMLQAYCSTFTFERFINFDNINNTAKHLPINHMI